jgi:hypothetical protein
MRGEEAKGGRGFTVVDKRASAGSEQEAGTSAGGGQKELPRVDFATFVISLGTSALYELGVAGDPRSGERVEEPNLALARQTIETLEMLQDKTRGNLDAQESELVEQVLYQLRMSFVEVRNSRS